MTDVSLSPSSCSSLLVGWTGDPVLANGSLDVSGGTSGRELSLPHRRELHVGRGLFGLGTLPLPRG